MKKTLLIAAFASTMILFSCRTDDSFEPDVYLDFAMEQVEEALKGQPDINRFARNIPPGEKHWGTTGVNGWTSGFFPGILWYMYEYSGDVELREEAHRRSMPLEVCKDNENKHHDLGFMVYSSLGNGYRLTDNPKYREIVLETADSLAALFNPNVGTILSWPGARTRGWSHNTIVDNMMNLELLFWASKNGGDQNLYDIAVEHAQVTAREHLRPDYSSYHVVVFDSLTGDVDQKVTHQGYADESMWARGQAWGIYGFTMTYRETGMPEFLETAKNMASVYLDRLPEDHVPYWDFDAPNIPEEERDASAAAITASALLELSTLVDNDEESVYYRSKATDMLRSLSRNYRSDGSNVAVLWHSVGSKPGDSEVDVPIIYADYYYIEALLREKKLQEQGEL